MVPVQTDGSKEREGYRTTLEFDPSPQIQSLQGKIFQIVPCSQTGNVAGHRAYYVTVSGVTPVCVYTAYLPDSNQQSKTSSTRLSIPFPVFEGISM